MLKVKTQEQQQEDLEKQVYEAYYKKNPDGDARVGLWGQVIKAKKDADSIKSLKDLLAIYQKQDEN